MIHLLRRNKVRRIGAANAENTTAPRVSSAVIRDVAASASARIRTRTMVWSCPCRRRHHIDNPKGGSTSGASRGAASGTARPNRWMRGNREAW
jgi:hypothetical protein